MNKRNKHTTTVSIYADQLDRFKKLGGSKWLRNVLDSQVIEEKIVLHNTALDALKKLRDFI